ncbi:MAG: mannose-1-phosphate guanylyltransferase/mannose-6-phosphate isomerase [Desulfuromonadaceae bacterium]|nr:mannose-1-phosphate guanylyltransferase/mannose-6-phosphate isomerase [Desulfuromonadaceae bacterium]
MIVPVILSGGSGTRLWPLSRQEYPKQLLPLIDDRSLLQNTALRLRGVTDEGAPLVICNQSHRFIVAEQLRQIDRRPSAIILEPMGRNTAPAVAVAALHSSANGEDPILAIMPSDHVISDMAAFARAMESAVPLAGEGALVTFGIVPDRPETGFGYIRKGGRVGTTGNRVEIPAAFAVEMFVEKPDQVTAQKYLASGQYTWNSGMFLFKASIILAEMERLCPDILESCRGALSGAQTDLDFIRLDDKTFSSCRAESIDYAVMEKTSRGVVVPLDAGWDDVGSWQALWAMGCPDGDGNVMRGDVIARDCHENLFQSHSRLVAAVGVRNLVVVETPDAVLVADRDQAQRVKEIAEQLKKEGRAEFFGHVKVHRPWGSYQTVDHEERFQVKRITVNPGATLSLQMHHHRAEHWVVVKGTARVICDDREIMLSENQSTFIPLGTRHRLENPGRIPLELIEVQSGSYLGEDDIVRFEDKYGR